LENEYNNALFNLLGELDAKTTLKKDEKKY
jgi:hypothetical protein